MDVADRSPWIRPEVSACPSSDLLIVREQSASKKPRAGDVEAEPQREELHRIEEGADAPTLRMAGASHDAVTAFRAILFSAVGVVRGSKALVHFGADQMRFSSSGS